MPWTATVINVSQIGSGNAQIDVLYSNGIDQKLVKTHVVSSRDALAADAQQFINGLEAPLVDIKIGDVLDVVSNSQKS